MPSFNSRTSQGLDRQRLIAIIIIILSLMVGYLLYRNLLSTLAVSWFFGLAVGFIFQRSRICFTAAMRDPVLFGLTKLSRALVLSLMITSLGFAALQYYQVNQGLTLSGNFVPLGWHIPLGAFVFGLGAAISGGCASGTLVRAGEGFQMQWLVLIGFTAGSVHGAHDSSFWYQLLSSSREIHLPSLMGWEAGVLIQILLLAALYYFLYLWEEREFPGR